LNRNAGITLLLIGLLLPSPAAAQEGIHWAYASYFGTGTYSLDTGVRTVLVGLAPKWEWRSASISESGQRTVGIEFRLPISVGAHEFSTFETVDELTPQSVNAVSIVPGVHLEIPMTERWSLKALAYVGKGTEIRSSLDATIFRLGFRSRIGFRLGDTEMSLVNGLERIGYSDSNSVSDAINLLTTGLDFSRPLRRKKIGSEPVVIHWHAMYTSYLDTFGLDLSDALLEPESIGNEWELGVGFGRRNGRLGVWKIRIDRLGLAYRIGTQHEFSGVKIVFRSLFDR
jgi:hypothetical protein